MEIGRRNIDAFIELLLKPLNGHQRRHQISSALLHHVESFVVEKSSVLDRVHTRANRALCGFGAVAMRRHFQTQRVRFVNDGVELFLRELRRIDIVGGREYAAAGAGLDHVGAVLVHQPHRVSRLIRAIDHALRGSGLVSKQALRGIHRYRRSVRRSRRSRARKRACAAREPCRRGSRCADRRPDESCEPTSRTVVKPAISVTRTFDVASSACSAMDFCSSSSSRCL